MSVGLCLSCNHPSPLSRLYSFSLFILIYHSLSHVQSFYLFPISFLVCVSLSFSFSLPLSSLSLSLFTFYFFPSHFPSHPCILPFAFCLTLSLTVPLLQSLSTHHHPCFHHQPTHPHVYSHPHSFLSPSFFHSPTLVHLHFHNHSFLHSNISAYPTLCTHILPYIFRFIPPSPSSPLP